MSSLQKFSTGNPGPISLQPMRHLMEAIEPDDDWTGLSARSERKKRQNRLNQRAHRRRREAEAAAASTASTPSTSSEAFETPKASSNRNLQPPKKTARAAPKPSPIEIFSLTAQRDYQFPVSTDHLMLLVQYNFYRGCLTNMSVLSIGTPHALIISTPQPHTPPSFAPTFLQRSIMHPAWIDSIPCPILRDNFIRENGTYDADEFWYDVVGTLHEAYKAPTQETRRIRDEYKVDDDKFSGLMCWSEPWDIASYEVSPGNLKKWWRLLRGSEGIIRSTNHWRRKRGEKAIRFTELLGGEEGGSEKGTEGGSEG